MAGSEKIYLDLGQKYPYDMSDSGRARKPKDWYVRAARGVVKNLCDRRSIKWGFQEVDHHVRKELIDSLAEIIRLAHKEFGQTAG